MVLLNGITYTTSLPQIDYTSIKCHKTMLELVQRFNADNYTGFQQSNAATNTLITTDQLLTPV